MISFIILTFNSEKYLTNCFDSIIYKCTDEKLLFEILVVDNGSTDNSRDILERYSKKIPAIFKPTYLKENRGTTYPRNIALKRASGQFICILDSDTELNTGSIKEITNLLTENMNIGIVAPKLFLDNRKIQNSVKKFPSALDKLFKIPKVIFHINSDSFNKDFYPNFPFAEPKYVETAISACWFFRSDLLNEVGYLDEKIFYAPEDLDFCIRLHKLQKSILYYPFFSVLHHTQQLTYKSPFSKLSLCHFAGLIYYFRKHGGWLSATDTFANQEKKQTTGLTWFLILMILLFVAGVNYKEHLTLITLEIIFWLSMGLIAFTTIGYPVLIILLGLLKKTLPNFSDSKPAVSLIISAFNEEKIIREKIENSLALNYPEGNLEIIVASDGSTDSTEEIVQMYKNDGVILHSYPKLGKTGIQNESVKKAKGEIIIFSDANAMYQPESIKKLVRHFGNKKISCVCGQLEYEKKNVSRAGVAESLYWRYEKLLKKSESNVSSIIGANGSIYAVRKEDYVFLDPNVISDLVEPLQLIKKKKRVIYEPDAISTEQPSVNFESEYNRKVRILVRSINGIFLMRCLFNPFQYGFFSFQLLFHKLFRYMIPFFWIINLMSLILLTQKTFYLFFFLLVFLVVLLAITLEKTKNNCSNKLLSLVYYYMMVNIALIKAWYLFLRNKNIVHWSTDR